MSNIQFVQKRKIWYILSGTLVVLSIICFSVFGLRYGLDFTGGSLIEVEFSKGRPTIDELNATLATAGITVSKTQPSGDNDFIIRLPEISQEKHQAVLDSLSLQAKEIDPENQIDEKRFESFGPTLGNELRRNALYAIAFVLLAIIAYLAYAFRKVTRPVAAWKFGVVAVVALFHDILIPIGLFSLLGHFFGTEVDSLFVTALLTILGFSVHDTIVTLDRIRENLFVKQHLTFEEVVNTSINETVGRSINTSATTLFSLMAIYFFGGSTIKDFALVLIVGIVAGTYSSIFIASPLLVTWHKFTQNRRRS